MGNNFIGKRTSLLSRHDHLTSNPQKSHTSPGVDCRLLAQLVSEGNQESDVAEYPVLSSGFSVGITDRHTQNIQHTPNTHTHSYVNTHTKLKEIKKKCSQ